MQIKLLEFNTLGDDRGKLISLESYNNIPFDIKRVYYVFETKHGVARGFHAHKTLNQLAVCIKGSCRFIMDDGTSKADVILDSNNKGLLIEPMVWHEMHDFSVDCVLLVLAEQNYDEADYIRDYNQFVCELKSR